MRRQLRWSDCVSRMKKQQYQEGQWQQNFREEWTPGERRIITWLDGLRRIESRDLNTPRIMPRHREEKCHLFYKTSAL